MIEVSYFEKCTDVDNPQHIPLKKGLDIIKSDKYKKHTDYLRQEPNKDKRSKYKRNNLPAITFSGKFSYRNNDSMIYPSGISGMDIDDYTGSSRELKEKISKDKYVMFVFISPSGGLKVGVKIPSVKDDAEYKIVYSQLLGYYKQYSPKNDSSTKDISRLCFLSHDPEIYINMDCEVFPVNFSKPTEEVMIDVKPTSEKDNSRSAREMFEVVKLIGKGLSKEEVYGEMMAFSKWSSSPKQYKELTYSKAQKYIESKKQNEDNSIEYTSVSDIIDNDIPEPRWRIEGLVPEAGVTYIASPPGTGKTMLALYASQCISSGKDFLGKTVMPGKIIYFDGENGEICAFNRLKKIAIGNDFSNEYLKNFNYSIFPHIRFNPKDSSFKSFKKFFDEFDPDVIFFDSLVRFMEGSENDSESCKLVFDTLRSLLKEKPSLTIIILHHLSKMNNGGMNALRGSSEIAAAASSILLLRRLNYAYEIKIEKNRYLDIANSSKVYYNINDVENGLLFETTAEQNIPSDSVGRASVDFWEWVNENKIQTFASKDCETKLKTNGHSKSAVFRLIGDLLKDQYIMKIKRGYYNIIDNPITSEEEVKDD